MCDKKVGGKKSFMIAQHLPNQTRVVKLIIQTKPFPLTRPNTKPYRGQRGQKSNNFSGIVSFQVVTCLRKRMETSEKSARREVFNYNRKFKWVSKDTSFDSFPIPGNNCWASRWSWRTCSPSTGAPPTSSSSSRTTSRRRSTSEEETPSLLEGSSFLQFHLLAISWGQIIGNAMLTSQDSVLRGRQPEGSVCQRPDQLSAWENELHQVRALLDEKL